MNSPSVFNYNKIVKAQLATEDNFIQSNVSFEKSPNTPTSIAKY